MKANGKTIYSCQEKLVDGMVLEPMHEYVELRDLVVDLHQRNKKG
jgi:succinate dehydrogenase/fumarate reductase-like Fe-S protein